MAKIHITLQGKGGSAKTTNSAFMAQFLRDHYHLPICVDTDPVNASFHAYKDLKVKTLQIMSGGDISSRAWDTLVEIVCTAKNDVVIDNGATSFTNLLAYMHGSSSIELFHKYGQQVCIHIPISGCENLDHCVSGMRQIVECLAPQGPRFVIWINPFLGPIERMGKTFEQFDEYLACREYIEAIIYVPPFTPAETFGRDLVYLLSNNLTFAEALQMKESAVKGGEKGEIEKKSVFGFEIAVMQRISIIRKKIYDLLSASGIFLEPCEGSERGKK